MTRVRDVGVALVAVAVLLGATGCSSSESYEISARFSRAIALYDESDVKVMGATVGHVSDIEIDGDGIIVTMSIDEGVPIPADATAAIATVSLIGERTVVLGPAWTQGEEKMAPGTRIPIERTRIPVEPDEGLQVITDLIDAMDPDSVDRLLTEAAGALEGNGRTINQTLGQLAQLVPDLAEQDDELVEIAADVRRLAAVVERRDAQIGQLLEDFAAVSGTLAAERGSIVAFLDSLASLTAEGKALLTAHESTIPEDLETMASVALTIHANAEAVKLLVSGLERINGAVIEAWDPETQSLRARVHTTQTALGPLYNLLDALGLGRPCIPVLDTVCGP